MTGTDAILNTVYLNLGINHFSEEQKYLQINNIVAELQIMNTANLINGKTTGTISERISELALKSRVPTIYKNISDKWNWMADFSILGNPFHLLI